MSKRLGCALALAAALGGCGSAGQPSAPPIPPRLLAQARPIGRGPRFQPPAAGPVLGPCARRLARRFAVHIEVFAANRVVLVPAGLGTRGPRTRSAGRISSARCYGGLVTLDPTGVVLVRPGRDWRLADLFRGWGQPLGARRLLSFGGPVRVYVGGRRWVAQVTTVPLTPRSEIVVETGPYVPPHGSYTFPPLP